MKKRDFILRAIPFAALVLELSGGVVLYYARPSTTGEIGHFQEIYSYFSLTPVRQLYVSPFLTGLLTCALALCACQHWRRPTAQKKNAIALLAALALLLSLFPLLLMGARYYTVTALLVSLLMLGEMVLSMKGPKGRAAEHPSS